MPYTPPDLGRVLRHLDVIRVELSELEKLLDERSDHMLALLVGELRSVVERIEKHAQSAAKD